MSKHLAEQSATTAVREHVAAALARIGQNQRGYGKHRDNYLEVKDADA